MVQISSIAIKDDDQEVVVSAQIQMPGFEDEAWYRLPINSAVDHEAAVDAFYIVGLVLAMGSDGVLQMDQPASSRLVYSTRAIQDILLGWYPKRLVRADEIDVPVRETDLPARQRNTVACFTGGVDSFDTLIVNRNDIDALLYVHGFDVSLSRTEIRATTSAHLRDVAATTGKELIEVSTNIRRFLNRAATWPAVTHGPALASVGHLLSGRFGRQLIPASHTYADSYAWGSHPLLDHLWSSNRLAVLHDGAGSTRVEKTRRLASDVAARRHLRVCWQNTGVYNCGKCDKCVRTMIALELTGVLPEFETFESQVSLDDARKLSISGLSGRSFVLENLAYAQEQGATEIAGILADMVAEFDARKAKKDREKGKAADISPDALVALEKRVAATDAAVRKLQNLLPIRMWVRFTRWVYRTRRKLIQTGLVTRR